MEPVTLATIASSITILGLDVIRGLASEGAKDLWQTIKKLLQWSHDPAAPDLAVSAAESCLRDPAAAAKIVELMKAYSGDATFASALVNRVDAKNIIVTGHIHGGTITMR
jgi:hypothetical protein